MVRSSTVGTLTVGFRVPNRLSRLFLGGGSSGGGSSGGGATGSRSAAIAKGSSSATVAPMLLPPSPSTIFCSACMTMLRYSCASRFFVSSALRCCASTYAMLAPAVPATAAPWITLITSGEPELRSCVCAKSSSSAAWAFLATRVVACAGCAPNGPPMLPPPRAGKMNTAAMSAARAVVPKRWRTRRPAARTR
jgi:hypothetical protein